MLRNHDCLIVHQRKSWVDAPFATSATPQTSVPQKPRRRARGLTYIQDSNSCVGSPCGLQCCGVCLGSGLCLC